MLDSKPEKTAEEIEREEKIRIAREEEEKQLTLDEYLAQRAKEALEIPKLENVRSANDGLSDIFKDAQKLSKEEEENYFSGKVSISFH